MTYISSRQANRYYLAWLHRKISRGSGDIEKRLLHLLCALATLSRSSKPKFDLVPVHGKVLYKDQPAGGVLLIFLPPNETDTTSARPLATTEKDGTFTLVTGEEEGAPVGDYIVIMQWLKQPPPAKNAEPGAMVMGGEPVDALKGKYIDRKKGFKVKVEKGKTELQLNEAVRKQPRKKEKPKSK